MADLGRARLPCRPVEEEHAIQTDLSVYTRFHTRNISSKWEILTDLNWEWKWGGENICALRPPCCQFNFFIFVQFSAKTMSNNRLVLPLDPLIILFRTQKLRFGVSSQFRIEGNLEQSPVVFFCCNFNIYQQFLLFLFLFLRFCVENRDLCYFQINRHVSLHLAPLYVWHAIMFILIRQSLRDINHFPLPSHSANWPNSSFFQKSIFQMFDQTN